MEMNLIHSSLVLPLLKHILSHGDVGKHNQSACKCGKGQWLVEKSEERVHSYSSSIPNYCENVLHACIVSLLKGSYSGVRLCAVRLLGDRYTMKKVLRNIYTYVEP
jgi:hypothetical protein